MSTFWVCLSQRLRSSSLTLKFELRPNNEICHQAPSRAGRLRELAGEARESGGSKSQLRLSPTVLPSLFNSFKHAFQHDGNSAIVRTFTTMTLLYRVFAVFATRDSETVRRGARLLSHIEMREHETLNSKHVQEADQSE